MSPLRRLACVAATAALALPVAVAGCGDDEPEPADETTTELTTTTETAAETTTGVEPEVTDEGHEGGGPDPGTQEAEDAAQHSGGTEVEDPEPEVEPTPDDGGGGAGGSSGGASPTDSFDQFCESNPAACE